MVELVAELGLGTRHIRLPGTLDGGDVLKVGKTIYVGRGGRTNAEGIRQFRAMTDFLKKLDFKKDEKLDDDLDIVDPTAERIPLESFFTARLRGSSKSSMSDSARSSSQLG